MHRKRATITQRASPESCTLEYTDAAGTKHRRVFFAPADGGEVHENPSDPDFVFSGLLIGGEVLGWDPRNHPTLSDLIRRERRRGLALNHQRKARRAY
jgi:hypothetical protein